MDYLKKSRIEEVLIAILGKGMVTSQLISRIEKILDAIRTDGSYDGPVMSEVEEILVCILNGEPFKKPTHSRIAAMLKVKANGGEYTELRKSRVEELIFEWINAVESATYTGTLPATLRTVEGYLESYKIYGNTAQDGTPTPDSPIIPSGCGEKTENLIRCTNTTSTTGGGAVINQTDGGSEVIVSRTATNTPSSVSIDVLAELSAGTYTLSVDGLIKSGSYDNILIRDGNGNIVTSSVQSSKPKQFTISTDTKVVKLTFVFAAASDYSNQVIRVMLNLGSTALPYEPYGYKLPILSNSTVTNIYLGEAETTRRIKKLVLTGNESWTTYNMAYYIKVNDYYRMYDVGSHLSVCSHYPNAQMYTIPEMHYGLGGLIDGQTNTRWNGNIVFNPSPMISSRTDWISYLAAQYAAGTPVIVWYVLAEPEPAVVNEPLMKIGDYADTIDSTQTDVQIPTTAGSTTISWAGEGLAPSGVELTYSKPKSKWKE